MATDTDPCRLWVTSSLDLEAVGSDANITHIWIHRLTHIHSSTHSYTHTLIYTFLHTHTLTGDIENCTYRILPGLVTMTVFYRLGWSHMEVYILGKTASPDAGSVRHPASREYVRVTRDHALHTHM